MCNVKLKYYLYVHRGYVLYARVHNIIIIYLIKYIMDIAAVVVTVMVRVCTCVTYVCLEGGDGSAERRAARRKTDLMPTILSPRDLTPCSRPGSASSSRRSPGRASSMTRLDGAAADAGAGAAYGGGGRGGPRLLSSARSMSHLAGGGGGGRSVLGANKDRSTHHRSMIALNPVPPPRPTRAERLRKRAREFANGGGPGTWMMPVVYII